MPHSSTPSGRATLETALWPFQGLPAPRAGSLQPSSTVLPFWTLHAVRLCVEASRRVLRGTFKYKFIGYSWTGTFPVFIVYSGKFLMVFQLAVRGMRGCHRSSDLKSH
jgi:hypothetical protein